MSFFKRKGKSISKPAETNRSSSTSVEPNRDSSGNASSESVVLQPNETQKIPIFQAIPAVETALHEIERGIYPIQRKVSRLHQPLEDVLSDGLELIYFIAFLESRHAAHLARFWHEAKGFLLAAQRSLADSCSDTASAVSGGQFANSSSSPTSSNGTQSDEAPKGSRKSVVRCVPQEIEQDALRLYSKYVRIDAEQPIDITEDLRKQVIGRMCCEDGSIDPLCFVAAQDAVFLRLLNEQYMSYMNSELHCQCCLELLTQRHATLDDIMHDQYASFYFMEFLEQEQARHLLEFVLMANNFEEMLSERDRAISPDQAMGDAMVIYDRFFSMQSPEPLGLPDRLRLQLESDICAEEGARADCFRVPVALAIAALSRHFLPLFFDSDIFIKYLNELITSMQNNRHKPRSRDSEETSSVCSNNTLLAGSQPSKDAAEAGDAQGQGQFSIDTENFNPDSLWRRPKTHEMRFGMVDHLGQFSTNLEPHPELKRNVDSGFLQKLSKKKDDKSKEELALRIAQMIIDDVNNMTQIGESEDGFVT